MHTFLCPMGIVPGAEGDGRCFSLKNLYASHVFQGPLQPAKHKPAAPALRLVVANGPPGLI